MSLDGRIIAVEKHPDKIILTLGPRPGRTYVDDDGEIRTRPDSIPGQERMTILEPTWTPHVGDDIWGGDRQVIIVSGGFDFPYDRVGYNELRQQWFMATPGTEPNFNIRQA